MKKKQKHIRRYRPLFLPFFHTNSHACALSLPLNGRTICVGSQEKEEAARARLLLRRAAASQAVYETQFKQSAATRERLTTAASSTAFAPSSSSSSSHRQIPSAPAGNSTALAAAPAPARASAANARACSLNGSSVLGKGLSGGSGGGRSCLPNFPILDLLSGQWRGVWDLFKVNPMTSYSKLALWGASIKFERRARRVGWLVGVVRVSSRSHAVFLKASPLCVSSLFVSLSLTLSFCLSLSLSRFCP